MGYVEYKLGGGLDLKASPDRISDDSLQRAVGCVYDQLGALKSDPGREQLFNAATGPVLGIGDAKLSGSRFRFVKINGNLYRGLTLIGPFGSGTGQISSVPYNGYVYITDGEVFKRYSLAKGLQDVGLSPPDITGLSVTINAVSDKFLSTGNYKWVITYFNGVAESNFSVPMPGTATANDSATIPTPAVWPEAVTEVRVYRTMVGGDTFFRVGEVTTAGATLLDPGGVLFPGDPDAVEGDEVTDEPRREDTLAPPTKERKFKPDDKAIEDYNTEQFGSDVVQSNLGIIADWDDHEPPLSEVSHLIFVTDRIYAIRKNRLLITRVAAPEHWPTLNNVQIGRQTGEDLRTIMPLGSDIICYTASGIWRFRPEGEDLTQSQLMQLEVQVGIAGEWAVTDLEDGSHVFLSDNGVYRFDGRTAQEISFAVEPIFTDPSVPLYIVNKTNAVAGSLRDKVWISYQGINSPDGENNRTLYIDFQDPQNPKFSVLDYGYASLRRTLDNKLLGGDKFGNVYQVAEGSGANGSAFDIATKSFPFQGPTQVESYDRLVIDADLGGVDHAVSVVTDTGRSVQFVMNWSGRKRVKRWLPADLTGHTARVQITTGLPSVTPRTYYGVGFGAESEGEP